MRTRILTLFLAVVTMLSSINISAYASTEPSNSIVIDVADYGADPSGGSDSTVAIQKALEAAKQITDADPNTHVTLSFPKGEYQIYKDFAMKREYYTSNTGSMSYPNKWIGILIENQRNLTIDGNGSLFLMHGNMMALAVVRSQHVILKNFVLDYEVPDTIDMTIVSQGSMNGKPYTDMYVPANFRYEISEDKKHITWLSEKSPYTGETYWTGEDTFNGALVIYKGYDETVRRHYTTTTYEGNNVVDADPFVGVESIAPVEQNIIRFTYKDRQPRDQEVGNVYLLTDSFKRATAGAFIWESSDTLIKDIDVHYLSGFGWLTQMSHNTEFNGINFLPRQGTGKYTTSNADQIHVAGASGYFNVFNTNFSMAHDDPINVHGSYLRVEEVIDKRTLKLRYIHFQQGGFPAYFPGDQVMFYSRTHLETAAHVNEEDTFTVASAIHPGESYNGSKLDRSTTIVTFSEDFSQDVLDALQVRIKRNGSNQDEPLYVAENVTYAPNVHIKGNIMRSIPTRGILATTRNQVIIEDNIFENLAMASIYVSNDADFWYESGPVRNMTIRNNKFYVRPTGQTEWGVAGPLWINPVIVGNYSVTKGIEPTPKGEPVHRNINFVGNEIHMGDYQVIVADGVKGLNFENNTIVRDKPENNITLTSPNNSLSVGDSVQMTAKTSERILPKDIFEFRNSSDIILKNNRYDDGFNMNVKVSGGEAPVIIDDPLTVNGTGTIKRASEKLKYASLNPEVVQVDDTGTVTAITQGSADVIAYYEWNGTIIKSAPVAFTVEGGNVAHSLAIYEADNQVIESEHGTLQFTASESQVRWSVVDAQTLLPTDKAAIDQNGRVTALKDGVVKIIASAGGATATRTVINSFPFSYGMKGNGISTEPEFAPGFYIPGPAFPDKLHAVSNTQMMIEGEKGDIYGSATGLKNLVAYTLPDHIASNDLRIQVTIEGLPAGSGFSSVSMLVYGDNDNYISAGAKSHLGIASVNEKNGSPKETTPSTQQKGLTKAVFEIERNATGVITRYKQEGGNWTDIASYPVEDIFDGDQFKIAFMANHDGGAAPFALFSDFKIAMASAVNSEQLELQQAVPFYTSLGLEPDGKANLEEGVRIHQETDHWFGTGDKNAIGVHGEPGDLYMQQTTAKNTILFDVPAEWKNDLRAQGTISFESLEQLINFNASSMVLFKDENNYVSVGQKAHYGGVAVANEMNGFTTESSNGTLEKQQTVTFEMLKVNNQISLRVKDASGVWRDVTAPIETTTLGEDYNVGFVIWRGNTSQPITAVFSNIKLAKASESTTEGLEQQAAIPVFKPAANTAPTVSDLEFSGADYHIGDAVTVSGYHYFHADGHREGAPLFKWEYMKNGKSVTEFTNRPHFVAKEAGELVCTVYVFDQYGKPAKIPATGTIVVGASQEDRYELSDLRINGNRVDGFAPDRYEYTFVLPKEVAYFTVDYEPLNDTKGTTEIQDLNGTVLSPDILSLEDHPGVKIVRKEGADIKAVYHVDFQRFADNDTSVEIAVDGNALTEEIKAGTKSYFSKLENRRNRIVFTVKGAPSVQGIQLYRSFYRTPIADEDPAANSFSAEIDLSSGLNIFNLDVLAEDGKTVTNYKVHLFRQGFGESAATDIKLDGKTISDFAPAKTDYLIQTSSDRATIETSVVRDRGASVSITINGKRTEGESAASLLNPGRNDVVVAIVPENIWETTYYKLTLIRQTSNNANLFSLNADGLAIKPTVDPNTLVYTAQTYNEQTTIHVVSEHSDAKVQFSMGAQGARGVGAASGVIKLHEGENAIEVKIMAPDQATEKTYTLKINANSFSYLSDLKAQSVKNGYGELKFDKSTDGNAITLPDDNGKPVSYEKGLGAHAESEIIYNIEGQGLTSFEAFVGVDYERFATTGSVVFEVLVDGIVKFNSGRMDQATPQKAVTIDIRGAKTVILKVKDAGNGIDGDHADWADAKFIGSSLPPTLVEYDVKITQTEHGKITSDAFNDQILKGDDITFTFTPEKGFKVQKAMVNGEVVQLDSSNRYTLTNVQNDVVVTGFFAGSGSGGNETSYIVTATAGTGGSISPTGRVTVESGKSQMFTIKPDKGYEIDKVEVDGKAVELTNHSYTFEIVNRDHTIVATFKKIPPVEPVVMYNIKATAGNGGLISPSGNTAVAAGGKQIYMISANAGYQIADVSVDGRSVGSLTRYVFDNIKADHTIEAEFELTPPIYPPIEPSVTPPVTPIEPPVTPPVMPQTPVVKLTDITAHWAETGIKRAVKLGIVTGYKDATFRPKNPVTRAEFAVMLGRALDLQGSETETSLKFVDRNKIPAWARPFVAKAVNAGIIKGYGDNTFRSDNPLTRAEIAVMIIRALGVEVDPDAKPQFADADQIPAWARPYAAAAHEAGLIKGRGDGKFAANEKATRAEAVVLILAMLNSKEGLNSHH